MVSTMGMTLIKLGWTFVLSWIRRHRRAVVRLVKDEFIDRRTNVVLVVEIQGTNATIQIVNCLLCIFKFESLSQTKNLILFLKIFKLATTTINIILKFLTAIRIRGTISSVIGRFKPLTAIRIRRTISSVIGRW